MKPLPRKLRNMKLYVPGGSATILCCPVMHVAKLAMMPAAMDSLAKLPHQS
jgi:hypothetical protein